MIRNLTPHALVVRVPGGEITIQPEGLVPRVKMNQFREIGTIEVDGVKIPIRTTEAGPIEGLPEKEEGVFLVVSSIVRTHPDCVGRNDILSPDTSPAGVIRDESGRIIAVTGFQR